MKHFVLAQVPPGMTVRMIENKSPLANRLEDLGLIPGAPLKCLHKSPSGSPAAYDIQGCVIALRQEDTEKIWVEALPWSP